MGRWRHADSEMMLSLAALTHSARMTREVVRLEADFGMVLRLSFAEASFRADLGGRHAALVQAIADRDGAAARSLVHQHVDAAMRTVVERHLEVRR